MRRFLFGGALGVFLISVVLAACGGSGGDTTDAQARRFQDMWEIDKIEKDFHHAQTKKDIELMVSLFAPNATMTVGPGVTAAGVDEIRRFWVEDSAPFKAENNWLSDHPAYKLEITVNGDRGTLHFECHYIDIRTGEIVGPRPPTSTWPRSTGRG